MSKETLQLKEILPYVPFGLQMVTKDKSDQIWTLSCENINHALTWWKPLLIPLSEVPVRTMDYYNFTEMSEFIQWVIDGYLPHCEWENLVSNHYDVFNLIPRNVAINKLDYEK